MVPWKSKDNTLITYSLHKKATKCYVFEVVLGKDGLENDLCTRNIIKV